MPYPKFVMLLVLIIAYHFLPAQQKDITNPKVEALKKEVMASLDGKCKTAQEMVDMVFSFSELGFQETETSAYLTHILEINGFTIQKQISGIPTAWLAKWGNGKPIIALG